jgi:hypothetical protein
MLKLHAIMKSRNFREPWWPFGHHELSAAQDYHHRQFASDILSTARGTQQKSSLNLLRMISALAFSMKSSLAFEPAFNLER